MSCHVNLFSCIRNPGVCGGCLFPALYPSPQPHQPGRDQRQTGVHENREGKVHRAVSYRVLRFSEEKFDIFGNALIVAMSLIDTTLVSVRLNTKLQPADT